MPSPNKPGKPAVQEPRCVWMSAGILTYRLCDRNFDCDTCLLDAAIRGRPGQSETSASFPETQSATGAETRQLRNEYFYTRNHCWIKKIADYRVRVGLEPGLSRVLLGPKAFVFPSEGQRLQRRQICFWIVVEGGTLPFGSPCTGVVRVTNKKLIESPHLLASEPFDEGWIFELDSEESMESLDLLNIDKACSVYASDQSRFQMLFSSASHTRQLQVGVTMADGGQPLESIAGMMEPAKYFSLLRKAFPP